MMRTQIASDSCGNAIAVALGAGLVFSFLTAASPGIGMLSYRLLGGGEYPLMIMLISYVVNLTLALGLSSGWVLQGRSTKRVGTLVLQDFFVVLSAIPLSWGGGDGRWSVSLTIPGRLFKNDLAHFVVHIELLSDSVVSAWTFDETCRADPKREARVGDDRCGRGGELFVCDHLWSRSVVNPG